MASPLAGVTPPDTGFGGAPGSSPGSAPGGFSPAAGAPPGGGFGAPAQGATPGPGAGFGAPPAQPQQGFGGPSAAPAKKKKNPVMYVAIGCGALLALSCVAGVVFQFVLPLVFDDSSDSPNTSDSSSESGDDGSSLCSRAAECCEAYVSEMSAAGTPGLNVEQTCAGVRMAGVPDVTCQSTIDGYRTGLEALGRAVPASCQ